MKALAKRIAALEASRNREGKSRPTANMPSIDGLKRRWDAAHAELERRGTLPLEEQLELARAGLADMLDKGPPSGIVGPEAYLPGGYYVRLKQQSIRHLEIDLLERDGRVDAESASQLRENAASFVRGFVHELAELNAAAREE